MIWLMACAGFQWDEGPKVAIHPLDSTVFSSSLPRGAKPSPSQYFQSYQSSMGWNLAAINPVWILAANDRTPQGIPVRTLVRDPDRKQRITIFETRFPKGSISDNQVNASLAYLFKGESDSSSQKMDLTRPSTFLFKPRQDTVRHWGMLARSDTSLLFLNFESKDPIPPALVGFLPDIRFEYRPSNPVAILDSCLKTFMGAIENTLGLKAIEDSSWQIALKHFQTALVLDSTNAAYLINCSAIFQVRKDNLGGIDFLSNHPGLLAKSPELAGIMGAMYEDLQRYQEAKAWAIKALELDPNNTEWLINLSDALWGLGEKVHSKNVLLRRYSEKPDFRMSVYLASTLLGLEEYQNTRDVLVNAHRDTTPSPKSTEYYLRALNGLKEYEAALDFIREMGDKFPPTSNNFLFKGICEFNLKLYRLSGASAKLALDLDPTNREAQQLSTQISALMGSRSNLILRTPITPLKTKGTLTSAKRILASGSNLTMASQSPLTLITQNIVFSWSPKSRWKKTRHQFFYIHDARKLIRLSELTYEINPGYSRFYVNEFKLYDQAQTLMEAEKVSDFYVTKSHNTTLHPENLLVHLPIKARPGAKYLEVMSTEESQLPIAEFPYLRYDNAFPFPVLECTYEILHAPKRLLVSVFGETKIDSLTDRLVIRMEEPVAGFENDFRPANDEFGTGFSATPYTTWKEVGHHYQKMLVQAGIQFDSVPVKVNERAQEVIDHNHGISPVFSLFRYVRDSVRYNNFEFSLQALVPEKSESVLTNGYSDCKGHALLLMQMLRARSVEAHLCLVSLNHAGDIDQPSLHQFNHMIVHVPAQKGWPQYFLDPTEKQCAFRRSPLALEGKNVLVVDGENSRMTTVPEIDSVGEHRVQVFHNLKVDATQMAQGIDSLVLTGKVASEFRAHMHAWNPNTKYENLLSWLAQSYSSFVDERFRVLNEEDPDSPLILVFKYRRKFPYLTALQEFEHFPKLELSFLRFPKADSRKAPVYFPHEIQINSQWIYQIPSGFGWKSLNLDRELSEHYLHWLLSINQDNPETISVKQNWRIDPFVAMPEEYSKIQSEWEPILMSSGLKLVISKH